LFSDRNETTAYRNYLQAMTAYDLLPAHGIVLMICSRLSIRKTIHALCSQTSTKAAITTESESEFLTFSTKCPRTRHFRSPESIF
jgi:hypothetical protein